MKRPLILGLTGGIATGKSTFAKLFVQRTGAEFYDADAHVHGLLQSDPGVRQEILDSMDPHAYRPDGTPDRELLRNLVFSNPTHKKTLENILHPRVRETWEAIAADCRKSNRLFLADIPLLFEVGVQDSFDAVIVVACSESVRRERLTSRPGISPETAKKMIASQAPLGEKINQSHHVVWNDGSLEALASQSDFLSSLFHDPAG